jgi:AraC-like DNA-binding protein
VKLSAERRAELLNELRLRVLFKDKTLCRRYGISRSTLARLQREALERPMTQNVSDTVHVLCLTTSRSRKSRAA